MLIFSNKIVFFETRPRNDQSNLKVENYFTFQKGNQHYTIHGTVCGTTYRMIYDTVQHIYTIWYDAIRYTVGHSTVCMIKLNLPPMLFCNFFKRSNLFEIGISWFSTGNRSTTVKMNEFVSDFFILCFESNLFFRPYDGTAWPLILQEV